MAKIKLRELEKYIPHNVPREFSMCANCGSILFKFIFTDYKYSELSPDYLCFFDSKSGCVAYFANIEDIYVSHGDIIIKARNGYKYFVERVVDTNVPTTA